MMAKKYPTIVPLPKDPRLKYASKAEAIAIRKERQEKENKLKKYSEELDQEDFKEAETEIESIKEEIEIVTKKASDAGMDAKSAKEEKNAQGLQNKVKSLMVKLKKQENDLADKKKAKDKK